MSENYFVSYICNANGRTAYGNAVLSNITGAIHTIEDVGVLTDVVAKNNGFTDVVILFFQKLDKPGGVVEA